MAQTVISVVVPLYNKRSYLLRCLESIRRQSLPRFEAIIVDDGSDDGGGSLVSEIGDPRFRLVVQGNRGGAAARNRGIAESRTDLIALLDADDEWAPTFLESILALAHRYPEAGLYATGFRRCYGGVRPDRETTVTGSPTQLVRDYFRCACQGDLVTSSSVAVPKAVFARTGGFAEGVKFGADRDMWARIALRYPIGYDSRILVTYHLDAGGRLWDSRKSTLPYPMVVHSLRQPLVAQALPADLGPAVQRYVEFVLMKYTHSLLGLGDRATLCDVLRTERFRNFRYRAEAALLRVAVAVLPMRLIAALDVWCLAIEAQLGERVRRWRAGIGPRRLSDVITYVSARPRGGSADGL